MKRRHYLTLFILLFGISMWGLITTLNDSLGRNKKIEQAQDTTTPETPAPAQVATTDVIVDTPSDNQAISSPLTVTGRAKGNWFFEGSFPITLVTLDGVTVASGYVQAQSDWMTADYVPFKGTINFANTASASGDRTNGYLVLKNSNASGQTQFDKSVVIKVQW
jgi:hypothetical protein